MMSSIRNKRMMSELLKLKLEKLAFDIAVAKYIASEQSYKDVEALQGGKESNPVYLLSESRPSKKPKFSESLHKRVPHPLKSRAIKVPTAVWEIMIIKVVRSKRKHVTTVTRPVIL